MSTLTRGKVRWFDDDKGFGFIGRDDGEKDCFIHFSHIQAAEGAYKTLARDEAVEFEVVGTERGPMAVAVRTLDS